MTTPAATPPHDDGCCGAKTRSGTPCTQRAGWGTDHPGVGRCKLHGGKSLVRHGLYSAIQRPRIAALIAQFEALPESEALRTLPELAAARALFVDWVERYDEITEALLAWHASYAQSMRPVGPESVEALQDVLDELEALIGPVPEEPPVRMEPEGQPHGGWLKRERAEEAQDGELRIHVSVRRVRELLVSLQSDPGLKPRQMPDLADGHRILDTISKIVERVLKSRGANAISRKDFYRVMGEMGRVVELANHEPDATRRLEKIRDGWSALRLA